jgi:thiosulfate/3-mercaptopyruvate sulfurtransferase
MTDLISPIIQPTELLNIYQAENVVLVDVSSGKDSKVNYDKKHLDGALYLDLNTQLSNIKEDPSDGGRHPLPDINNFSESVAKLGISPNSHVVIYDDKNGANAAARFWWMLKSAGHNKVQVLNGGLQAAEKVGVPTNSKKETPTAAGRYEMKTWNLPLADIDEVEKASQNKNYLVIDVRDRERFNGEVEPIDLVAGHIPGAINIPYSTNMDGTGAFLSPEKLRTKYQQVFETRPAENIIVHCGSGVTACHSLLAIAYAGLEMPKLYVGSWSEWSRNNKPMVTK